MRLSIKERGLWFCRMPRPRKSCRSREPLPIHLSGPRPWRGHRAAARRIDHLAVVVLVAVYAAIVALAMWAYAPPPQPAPRVWVPVDEMPAHDPRPEPPLEGGGL